MALAASAGILLAQIVRTPPLIDVVKGSAPDDLRVVYPLLHIVFAPFTLAADWLNGGGTGDLIGFAVWALLLFMVGRALAEGPRRLVREVTNLVVLALCLGCFIWWGARWRRPILRLVATDASSIIFDMHSHTSASHDGRPGFGVAASAGWHRAAGFDAAFITDHNVFGAARQWRLDAAGAPPHMLNGEELSLNGLHMIVLGNDSLISNKPWDRSFDSSLALLQAIRRPEAGARDPYLIASLPEYSRNHWGPDVGRIIAAGAEGLEIWTTSPKAMDFPPERRRETIARARSLGLAMFGATDMHGLGYAATVWNVARVPGWQGLADSALTSALLASFRAQPAETRVIALRRRIAPTRGAQIVGLPLGAIVVLRGASAWHGLALLLWIWLPALLAPRLRRPR